MEKKILYSAVVLDGKSQGLLFNKFGDIIPMGWKVIMHHQTINLGPLPDDLKSKIGEEVTLDVISIGISDKAIAIGVRGFHSTNLNPHVTLAVNIDGGGKPKDSNAIDIWESLPQSFQISGIVTEISN